MDRPPMGRDVPVAKADQLLEKSSYGPSELKAIVQAFDDAWSQVAGNFGGNPLAVEAVRLKLANIVLANATSHHGDASALTTAALQALAACYRRDGLKPPTCTSDSSR
jgi:hypothetical protein